MRIIKLSNKDYEMRTKQDVQYFFEKGLRHKSSPGRFKFTKGRIAKKYRFPKDEKLVFTYQAKLVYLGYAVSGVDYNTDSDKNIYPLCFLVDVKRIYRAKDIRLKDFADALGEKILEGKNIFTGAGWPILKDSPKLTEIWESFKAPEQADISAGC
jgi:hypothetical protein